MILFIGVLEVTLSIPWSHSLKEKRMVQKSLTTRLRQRFNVSVAEVGQQELWQRAELAVVCVSGEAGYVSGLLDEVERYIEAGTEAEIVDITREIR